METILYPIATAVQYLLGEIWLPIVLWTGMALLLRAGINRLPFIHPQYHYHLRLATLLSLPAGILLLLILQGFEQLLTATTAESYNLKLIVVSTPLEIGTAEYAAGSSFSVYERFNLFLASVFIAGMGLSLRTFFHQWSWLKKFRSGADLRQIRELNLLDQKNRDLIDSIRKPIRYGFISRDIIPVTFGVRDPVIFIPESLKDRPEKLNLAIRHELIHISKNDFLLHMTVLFIQALFWFHPLVYLLKNEIIEYRELRCDSELLSEKAVSPKAYAALILELLSASNLQKNIPVNMAQESSNLKKRIEMITNKSTHITVPKQRYIVLFSSILLSAALVMACTDMQVDQVFDEEELEIMTHIDRTGERGFHEIIIFMSEEEQAERHENKMEQLQEIDPDHIESVTVLKGEHAVNEYGPKGQKGVILIKTRPNPDSYNSVMNTLGMRTVSPEEFSPEHAEEDFFVVVEEMPELIGGLSQLMQQVRYPEEARRAGIEGRVHVQFIVSEKGDVEGAQVVRGIGGGLDEEALRVVRQAKFTPGYQRGRPVRVQYAIPVFFRLANNDTPDESASVTSDREDPPHFTVVGYDEY